MAPKLLGSFAIKMRIGVLAGAVLVVGYALAPRAVEEAPVVERAEQRPAPLLEQQVQQRAAPRPFAAVQEAAARAAGVVAIQDGGVAVFVSPTHLLTHADALDGRVDVQVSSADGRTAQVRAIAFEPATGLVLLVTEGAERTPPAFVTNAPSPGEMAVAVAHAAPRAIAVPLFVTETGGGIYTLGAIGGPIVPGMPVYALDGTLLAIAAQDLVALRGYPANEAYLRLVAQVTAPPAVATPGEVAP